MARALVFPGQGSQAVGMGTDLAGAFATARDVFQEVDEALKQNLSKLMREGPESDLVLTENAQPALMAVSVAVVRILEKDGGKALPGLASHVAGHSLGEYSALAAAGSLQLSDAARLLKLRGQSMQKAVPPGVGSIANVCGTCHTVFAAKFAQSVHAQIFDKGCVECHSNHEIAQPSDAMLGTAKTAVCVTCHSQGEDAFTAAGAMHDGIEGLKAAKERAAIALQAERQRQKLAKAQKVSALQALS